MRPMGRSIMGLGVLAGLILLSSSPLHAEEEGKKTVVADGNQVSLEYTLKLKDGSTADSNVGGTPLSYTHGQGQLLPALEAELAGMAVDDTKHVSLTAEQGYGVVDPEAFVTVAKDEIPEDARHVGAQLYTTDPEGRQLSCRVHEVKEDTIVLNFNHPLAGEALHFDVKILAIE